MSARHPAPGRRAALHCLKARGGGQGIDPRKFVILGRSTGGQLSAYAVERFLAAVMR